MTISDSAPAQLTTARTPTLLSRHTPLVRVTHWITTTCFLALLVSGAEIVISHPRFYWGETGNPMTPSAGLLNRHFRDNLLPALADLRPRALVDVVAQHLKFRRPADKREQEKKHNKVSNALQLGLCLPSGNRSERQSRQHGTQTRGTASH